MVIEPQSACVLNLILLFQNIEINIYMSKYPSGEFKSDARHLRCANITLLFFRKSSS